MPEDRYNISRSTVRWRYALARPQPIFVDARLILHIRWWTFVAFIFAFADFTSTSYFHCSLENVIRLARSKLVGSSRSAVANTRLRPMASNGAGGFRNGGK